MPNPDNITAPTTLVSFGRSGTSLIADAFSRHPEFSNAGETGNLIFGAWRAVELAHPVINASIEEGRYVTGDTRATRVVRQTLLTTLPSDRPRWFQKPIGIPVELAKRFSDEDWDAAATWYWKVLAESFPNARYFTILRNPFDVVLSSRHYWGYDEGTLWWSLGMMSRLLAHRCSPVDYAVDFEQLVRDPRSALGALFDHLGVPFHEVTMAAFAQVHAPAAGRGQVANALQTRRAEWTTMDPAAAKSRFLEPITALFGKFGTKLEMPEQFANWALGSAAVGETPGVRPGEDDATEAATIRLGQTVARLNREIERLQIEYRNDFLNTKEQEHQERVIELLARITELEKYSGSLFDVNKRIKSEIQALRSGLWARVTRRFRRG